MATAIPGLRLAARNCNCRPTNPLYAAKTLGVERSFATTSTRLQRSRVKRVMAKLESSDDPVAREVLALSKEFQAQEKEKANPAWERIRHRIRSKFRPLALPERPGRPPRDTFMNIGDPDPWEYEDTLDDDDDDVNALGHMELEQHREIRHYARLAAWELPLLSKMAKPFQAPSADMPLRFRYTTYMGEQHPAEKKVVLEFSPADMPDLTDLQRDKLKKLAGVRYNPETDIVKMNCEMFETQAQNKRYLGDVVDSLLTEARDPTDTFEDIPLDTRHHHFKPKLRFPAEWELTTERRAELEEYRRQAALKDQQKAISGQIIDGLMQIEQGLNKPAPVREAIPELVMAGKRVAVRR